jgi:DNA-binding transcriptional regulator YhcF (GntR family)
MHASLLPSGMRIDQFSATPKHLQLAQGFLSAIEEGTFRNNDLVPSLNALKNAYDIPRVTAEKCYKHLRHIGVLESFPGKGYYFKNVNSRHTTNVLLLFNRLSAHKQIIYNSFVQTLGNGGSIDLAVYDNNFARFSSLIAEKKDAYSEYVVIPHFTDNSRALKEVINKIPRSKLILLDKTIEGVEGEYGAIFENFENDIYESMEKALAPLQKYRSIHIVFPEGAYYPGEILKGLERFCKDFQFGFKAISDLSQHRLEKGVAYITVMEDDLVTVIEKAKDRKLLVGTEIGVISYNETPLKKLILQGITTISTDFSLMGQLAAEMIVNRKKARHALPFTLTLRSSL